MQTIVPNIVMVGLKHCGKSSVGRLLAQMFQRPYYDADQLLEQYYITQYWQESGGHAISCREIYSQLGKSGFDQLQLASFQQFVTNNRVGAKNDGYILSLGGGAADVAEIGQLLYSANCLVILLEQELPLLFERIARGGLPPFLQTSAAANSPGSDLTPDLAAAFAKFCEISEPRLRRCRAWAAAGGIVYPCGLHRQREIAAELHNTLWNNY